MRVELFEPSRRDAMETALLIRRRVFVDEQSVPLEAEVDEHDAAGARAVHVLVFEGAEAIGAGRYYETPAEAGCAHVGRMAVGAKFRGRGAGRALLAALLDEARRRGCVRARLLAQVHAVRFYARAGFAAVGEPVWDAGILHQPMETALAGPAGRPREMCGAAGRKRRPRS